MAQQPVLLGDKPHGLEEAEREVERAASQLEVQMAVSVDWGSFKRG